MATELQFDPIAEARRHWEERWGPEVAPSMAAVTSIMRVQQILIGRLNAMVADLDLTFARYEALMLLLFSSRGSLPLGQDRRSPPGAPHERHEPDRRPRALRIRTPRGARVGQANDARRNHPGGPQGRPDRHRAAQRCALRHRLSRSRRSRGDLPAASGLSRPRWLTVSSRFEIPESEIELRASRSSGPGGQHANVTASRIEAVFDIDASPTLTDGAEAPAASALRPAGHRGRPGRPQPAAQPPARRSRAQRARRRGARPRKRRRPTRATKASRERRLHGKKRRSDVKRHAGAPAPTTDA